MSEARRSTASGLHWRHRRVLRVVSLLSDDTDEALAIVDRARFLLEQGAARR